MAFQKQASHFKSRKASDGISKARPQSHFKSKRPGIQVKSKASLFKSKASHFKSKALHFKSKARSHFKSKDSQGLEFRV
eukprot:356389-Hanusia_phi.AAC.1